MGTLGNIMNSITLLPEPSQAILDALENKQTLSYAAAVQTVEQWQKLIMDISICRASYTLHQNGRGMMTREGDLLEIHMDVDPLGDSDERGFMYASFSKGSEITARIASSCGDAVNEKRFATFLGFEGTWKEVVRKIIELDNLVISENIPPQIPGNL